MTCEIALERMLEGDPGALRLEGTDGELEAHLRSCTRCRAVAEALSAELASLDEGLESLATALPDGGTREAAAPPRRPGLRRAWVPLAAAAAVAAVLVLGRGAGPAGEVGEEVARGEIQPRVAVTLPADRSAAVLSTMNPKITVVWLYERSEP